MNPLISQDISFPMSVSLFCELIQAETQGRRCPPSFFDVFRMLVNSEVLFSFFCVKTVDNTTSKQS